MDLWKLIIRYSKTTVILPLFFVILLSITFACSWSNQTGAVTSTKLKGLTLSPLRSELNIAPGTSLNGTLTVINSTDKPMVVNLSATEFSVINQQYDYAFTAESNLAKWVTFSQSEINLAAGKSQKVTFTVGVPLSAEPGGRYVSLFASTNVETSDSAVESVQRIASLLYITVTGDVTRVGHLVSLSSPWLVSGQSMWTVALQNTGTTHFRSRYNVQTQNLFSASVASSFGDALILPNTIRLVSDDLPLPQLPGIYKIVYMIGLGDTPAVTETRYLLYMPPAAMIILVILVITASGLIYKRIRKH